MRKVGRFFLYCFSMLAVILISLEILVRVWGYSRRYFYDPIYMPYEKSPEIPYVMKPNLHQVRAHGNIWINTDALGLRSPVPARTYGYKQAARHIALPSWVIRSLLGWGCPRERPIRRSWKSP